jgi:hypothetical protein
MPSVPELAGYAEVRASWSLGVEGTPWALVERVRPRVRVMPSDRVRVEIVPEFALAQGRHLVDEVVRTVEESEAGPLLDAVGCAPSPPPRYAAASQYVSVERMQLELDLPAVDLTVGRQAVAWGSGLAFRPSDLYGEVLLTEPWRERRGVNALRAVVPVGDHALTALLVADDDLSGVSADPGSWPFGGALKGTVRAAGVDLSAVGTVRHVPGWAADGESRRDGFVGVDVRGTRGVGWWIEGGWHVGEDAPEVVAGVDWSLPVLTMFTVAAEGRWDGTGSPPGQAPAVPPGVDAAALGIDCALLPAPTSTRPRVTSGRAYADALVRVAFDPTWSASAAWVANLEDGSSMLVPSVAALLGSRVTAAVVAQVPVGARGEFRPEVPALPLGPVRVDFAGLVPDATLQAWVRTAF